MAVTGPAGVGKSSLIDYFLSPSGEARWEPVWATAIPDAGADGLTVGRQLALGILRLGDSADHERLATLLSPAAGDGGPGRRANDAHNDLLEALRAVAAATPFAVVVDDAHHVDEPSARLLVDLADLAAVVPLLVVLAWRSEEVTPLLEPLTARFGRRGVRWLELGPLSETETAAVVASVADLEADEAARVVAAAAGNPLLARELALAAPDRPARGSSAETARAILAERVRRVDGRRAISALALLGRPATVALLAQICEADPVDLQRELGDARNAGVVERHGRIGQYGLAHPWLVDATVSLLDGAQAQRLHLGIARALSQGGGSASWHRSEVARHYIASGVGDCEVARVCLDAALWEESNGAFEEAEELSTYGLDGSCDEAALLVQLMRVLGRCHARAGRLDAARDVLDRAVVLAREQLGPKDFAETVADFVAFDSELASAGANRVALLEEAMSVACEETGLYAILEARLAGALWADDVPRSRELAAQAKDIAERSADPDAVSLAYEIYASTAIGTRDIDEIRRLATSWRAQGPSSIVTPVSLLLAEALVGGDRAALDYGLARVAAVDAVAPRDRTRALIDVVLLSRAVLDGDAAEYAQLSRRVMGSTSLDAQLNGLAVGVLWYLHTGERPETPADTQSAVMPTPALARLFLTAGACVAAEQGAPGAMDWLQGMAQQREQLLEPPADLAWDVAMSVLGYAGGLLRDEEFCRAAIAALGRHCHQFAVLNMAVPVGPIGWFMAWAYRGLDDLDGALEANSQAEAASRRMGSGAWVTQCLLQRAAILAGRDPAAAGPALTAAREEARKHGLDALAARAAALGEALPPPELLPGSRSYQVLQLAAQGRTNEQIGRELFLSVSTVERHFTLIYRALGVRNRAEAVATVTGNRGNGSGSADPHGGSRRP